MKIVAFNGPPESGKDTLAEMLADHMDDMGVDLPVRLESLSLPLRLIAYSAVGLSTANPEDLDGETYKLFKETTFPQLGVTGRQLMIDVSEKFLKPTYGIEVMAKLLIERLDDFTGIVLIRDSGFQVEVDPLISFVGKDNLALVNVTREGKTFANDSREWVFHPNAARQMPVVNNGSLDDLRAEAVAIFDRITKIYGWDI